MFQVDYGSVLLFLTFCIATVLFHQSYKRTLNLPPGPWNLPIFGYLPWIDPKAPYATLTKLTERYGPLYGLYFGGIYTVIVADCKLMRKILMKDETMARPHFYLFDVMSNHLGILTTSGDLCKDQRRFLQTFFKAAGASKSSHNRNRLQTHITNQALDFIQSIQDQGNVVVINPADVLVHNIASVANLITLDVSWSRDDKNSLRLLHALDEIPRIVSCAGLLNYFPLLRFLPKYKKVVNRLKSSVETLLESFNPLIEKKKELLKDGQYTTNLIDAFLTEKSNCMPSSKQFYTDEQLGYLINDIFMASVDTTMASLSWYFLYMALYQDVQDKVRRELIEVLNEEQLTFDHLRSLPYLEATITEVMRIRSVIPLGGVRQAKEEIIEGRYRIPKGSMIVPLIWAVHMDPSVWKEPEMFKPERFIDDEGKFVRPEYFIAFSVGKRICLGEELSRMILFTFVAHIFRRFKIECEDVTKVDLVGDCGTTLVPKPQKLKFTRL